MGDKRKASGLLQSIISFLILTALLFGVCFLLSSCRKSSAPGDLGEGKKAERDASSEKIKSAETIEKLDEIVRDIDNVLNGLNENDFSENDLVEIESEIGR